MGVSRAQRERVALRQQAVLDAYEVYGTIAKACEVAGVPALGALSLVEG